MSNTEHMRVFRQGMELFDCGEYRQALECFRRAVEIDEEHDRSNSFLGMMLGRLGESEEAIVYLQRAIELAEDHLAKSMSHQVLALVLNDLGRVEEAIGHARTAAALDPDDPSKAEAGSKIGDPMFSITFRISEEEEVRILLEKGIEKTKEGDHNKALELLRTALTMDETGVMPNYWVGNVLGRLGESEVALTHLERALEHSDDDIVKAQTLVLKAMVLNDLGRRGEAVECVTRAQVLDPDDPHMDEMISILSGSEPAGSLGPPEKVALKRLKGEAEGRGDVTLGLVAEGVGYYKEGERERALDCFRRAVAADVKDARANHWLGVTLGNLGESEEALVHLERTIEYSNDDYLKAQTYVCIAVVLNDLGRRTEAIENALKAHALDRDDPHKVQLINNLKDPRIITSFGPRKKTARRRKGRKRKGGR